MGNMTYIKTAKESTNVPTAKETTVPGLKNLNKANWEKFQKLCSEELKVGPNIKNLIQFMETLVFIAQRCIPKNKIKMKRNRSWFDGK